MPIPIQALGTILISFIAFWTILCILLVYPKIQMRKIRSQIKKLQSREGGDAR